MYLLGPGKAAFVFFTDRLAPEVRIKQKQKIHWNVSTNIH